MLVVCTGRLRAAAAVPAMRRICEWGQTMLAAQPGLVAPEIKGTVE
jgi:hypothetical protein